MRKPILTTFARDLRRRQTDAERHLWMRLRGRELATSGSATDGFLERLGFRVIRLGQRSAHQLQMQWKLFLNKFAQTPLPGSLENSHTETLTLPSAMKIAALNSVWRKRWRIFMLAGWAAGPCFTPLQIKGEGIQNQTSKCRNSSGGRGRLTGTDLSQPSGGR